MPNIPSSTKTKLPIIWLEDELKLSSESLILIRSSAMYSATFPHDEKATKSPATEDEKIEK